MTMTKNSDAAQMKVLYSTDDRSRRTSLRILAGLVATAVIVAGAIALFAGGGSHKATTPKTRPSASATTANAGQSPYALNNDPAPSLAGAYSDNLKTAFLALYGYSQWVSNHPNPPLVANYTAVGGPAYKVELFNVNYLVDHHAHTPNDPRGYDGDIQFVKVSQVPRPILGANGKQVSRGGHPAFTGGLVTVVAQYVADNLYDAQGHYVQPGQKPGLAALSYSLVQGANGQWLLEQATVLNPPGGPLSVEH